jgi:hypothetical protein
VSVRHIGTLVRSDDNAGQAGKEGTLAAFDRSWYKPDAAEKLGQRTRLFASPRMSDGTGPGQLPPGSERSRQITATEVTYKVRGQDF